MHAAILSQAHPGYVLYGTTSYYKASLKYDHELSLDIIKESA